MAPLFGPVPCRRYRNAQRRPQQGLQAASHRRQDRGCRTRDGHPGVSVPTLHYSALVVHHRRRVACQPPELEIRDIGDLTTEQFRGIFRLTYSGDAYLVLRTKVQVRAIPASCLLCPPPHIHTYCSFLPRPILGSIS